MGIIELHWPEMGIIDIHDDHASSFNLPWRGWHAEGEGIKHIIFRIFFNWLFNSQTTTPKRVKKY